MKRLRIAAVMLALSLSVPPQAMAQQGANRDSSRVVVVHSHKTIWRDTRPNAHWDVRLHNGYYINNVWYFGPPPANVYHVRGFALGFKPWTPGDLLGYDSTRVVVVDYHVYHLQAPPPGYHYVRDDNTGEILLAAIATGIVAAIIAN